MARAARAPASAPAHPHPDWAECLELIDTLERASVQADVLIDRFFAGAAGSGVPVAAVRQCEIDSKARGYSFLAALRIIKQKIEQRAF
jgi:hypothetical protein